MTPPLVSQQPTSADQFRERVVIAVSMALRRRRISGRELSRRIAGDGSPGWWSKRYNGELALTVTDLGAISDATNTPVAELLGIHAAESLHPAAEHLNEFMTDDEVPRSVKDDVLGAMGSLMRLGYQRASGRAIRSKR